MARSVVVRRLKFDDVDHLIHDNKDGRYAWRPMELTYPGSLYVSLVNSMTVITSRPEIDQKNGYPVLVATPRTKCLRPLYQVTDK